MCMCIYIYECIYTYTGIMHTYILAKQVVKSESFVLWVHIPALSPKGLKNNDTLVVMSISYAQT